MTRALAWLVDRAIGLAAALFIVGAIALITDLPHAGFGCFIVGVIVWALGRWIDPREPGPDA